MRKVIVVKDRNVERRLTSRLLRRGMVVALVEKEEDIHKSELVERAQVVIVRGSDAAKG
ncbi:hypothetical protein Thal_1221 [Thermocrinis albus DSM 14484]|uniref:Uncharacterized protein n=1 Tax=Thermocrinis albus (strain DSM 14484 / JCM 11386 / HI 11/12) TaxID=638303 RepID=D3SM73_THEAH|nr:hypothetical protein [Thermocrinis albus]ADC89853.1 hypothetical protein Thal_1221 [Thermocrinis albus DSM 14484]